MEDDISLIARAIVDSKAGYLGVAPPNSKAQFDLLTKELVAFCLTLGYNEVELRCDDEPAIMQVAKLTIQAIQQMGDEIGYSSSICSLQWTHRECSGQGTWSWVQLHAFTSRPFESAVWIRTCFVDMGNATCCMDNQQVQSISWNDKLRSGVWKTL